MDIGFIHLPKIYANKLIKETGELDQKFNIGANFFRYHGEKGPEFPYLTLLTTGCMCLEFCANCNCCDHTEEKGFYCPCIESGAIRVCDTENFTRKVDTLKAYFNDLLAKRALVKAPTDEMKIAVSSLSHKIPVGAENMM